ncbi:MAG: hypothetical protein ABIH63_03580 [archaeon]
MKAWFLLLCFLALFFVGCSLDQHPQQSNYVFDKSKFCPDYGNCQDTGEDSRLCESSEDCTATCAYGCVSKNWMIGRGDCEALVGYTCECVDGFCQVKK